MEEAKGSSPFRSTKNTPKHGVFLFARIKDMAAKKAKTKKRVVKRGVRPRKKVVRKSSHKKTTRKPRLSIPKRMVASASRPPRKAKRTFVHRVEEVMASLLLLLCGVTANAAVVTAAGHDMQRLENETAFVLEAYKQPKEYLYDRATELNLDYDLLSRIAFCESNWRMVPNAHSSAYGFFQIIDGTERYTPSYKDGERKYDAQANIDMGVYLYNRYGLRPWNESKPCWKSSLPSD